MTAAKLRRNGSVKVDELRVDPSGGGDRPRRASWVALGVVLVLLSALLGAVVVARVADRRPVLALAADIERGELLTAEHLRVVEVATDDVALLSADRQSDVVGLVAVGQLAAGSLLSPAQFKDGSTVPAGWQIVGLALEPGGYPVGTLRPGDLVSVVRTPPSVTAVADGDQASGVTLATSAEVFAVAPMGEATRALMVSIAVPETVAVDIASAAAQDRLRLVLETAP